MPPASETKLFHRFPFVLFDRADAIAPGSARATRLVSIDDALLEGGAGEALGRVLMVEAMAQTAATFAEGAGRTSSGMLVGMKRVALHRAPRAGEKLQIEASLVQRFGDLVRIAGRVTTGGEELASGEILISLAGGAES